jgi:YgiT-type zinc finger domain-containing protein
MKCIHCQGKMIKGSSTLQISRKGCDVSLGNIAAWICGQCGEASFEETTVSAIQDLIRCIEQKAAALNEAGADCRSNQ